MCLYFITPTGHSLKSLDLVTMKKLDSKVRPPLTVHVLQGPPLGWGALGTVRSSTMVSRGLLVTGMQTGPLAWSSLSSLFLLLQWAPTAQGFFTRALSRGSGPEPLPSS